MTMASTRQFTADEIDRMAGALSDVPAERRPEIKTRTERDLVSLTVEDGRTLISEYTVTSYDDWRDTVIGPFNFGKVHFGPRRYIVRYPDGREEPTTQSAFIHSVVTAPSKERQPKRGGFLKWLFG